MSQIALDIPNQTPLALKMMPEEAAMKLFELGQLSSGAAARLAGIPRTVFLTRLADYGVDTFRLTAEELIKQTLLA